MPFVGQSLDFRGKEQAQGLGSVRPELKLGL